MGLPAAKQGDRILAVDIHMTKVWVVATTVTVPLPYPFDGLIDGGLSGDVRIEGRAAATVDSTASNTPPHIPEGISFQNEPSNRGRIISGSASVRINGKPAARAMDTAMTCNDPTDLPVGMVVALGNVTIGG